MSRVNAHQATRLGELLSALHRLTTAVVLATVLFTGQAGAQGGSISSEALSPPFDLYLGPGFIRLGEGALGAETSSAFPLYLGPGFSNPEAGSIASAVSTAFGLYLAAGFRTLGDGALASASSAAFPLYLGVLRESFAVSPAFGLDTQIANAFVGQIREAGSGMALRGVLVELYLGSTRVGSTTTDGMGSYLFFATIPGSYVVRASKLGYRDATTDLLRFTGATVGANLTINASSSVSALPDLAVSTADLTYTTITTGSLTLTAMVHNNGGASATNVHVRFYDASLGSGVSQFVPVPGDPIIASLAPGEAKPVSVNWTPPSGHQRFYVFADPDDHVSEPSNLNNGSAKDLGAYSGTPPRVLSASSEFDGIDAPSQMGRFLSGAMGGQVRFSASVSDPDLDVARVAFDFDGTSVTDLDGSDGWSVRFDPGTLQSGVRPLTVTAYDRSGLRSEPLTCQLIVDGLPLWALSSLVVVGENDGHQGLGGGVQFKDGYTEFTLRLNNQDLGNIGREPLFVDVTHDQDVVLIGETRTKFEVGLYLTVSKPMRSTLPWKISGVVRRSETLFNREFSSDDIAVTAVLSSDGQHLESIGLDYNGSVAFGTPEVMVPVGSIGPIPVSLGVSADLVLAAHAFGTFASDLTSYELGLDPSVSGQINGIARVGVKYANLAAILSPRLTFGLQLRYAHPANDMTASGRLGFDITGKIVGTLGKPPFGVSGDLLRFELGPWEQQILGTSPAWANAVASASDSVSLAGPFPSPTSAQGPAGQVAVAYIADADPEPALTRPEVFFAERDTLGMWSIAEPVTANDVFKSAPVLTYSSQGNPLVVWVQNSTPVGLIPADASLGWLLDNQDLWWSTRGPGGWTAPLPLIADTVGPARADGLPAIATTASGATAVWSRSPGDSALAPGTAELFAARFDGASWSTPQALMSDLVDDVNPSICGLRGDSTLVLWLRQDPSTLGQSQLAWTSGSGAGWASWAPLQNQNGSLREPALARVPGRGAVAAWVKTETRADSSLVYRILAATFDESANTWSFPEEVTRDSHFIESPVLRVDARGIAAVVWRGYAGCDGDLMVALKDLSSPASAWTLPRALTDDALTDWMTTAVIDGQNNLHVIDLKSDLNASLGSSLPRGNFVGGLSLASRGISRDLGVSNDLNFGFRPLSSDLRLMAGSVSVSKNAPAVGDTITALARVDNIGDSRSVATTVRFYDGSPDSGGVPLPAASAALGPIAPDSSLTVGVSWIVTSGPHRLYCVADPDNVVPEQTESNNRAWLAFGILADIMVDSLRVTNDNPIPGAADSVTAYVRNGGGASADNFALRLVRGAVTLRTVTGLVLGPGQAEAIALPFSVVSGADTLSVIADPDSVTSDVTRSNNRVATVLKVLPDLSALPDSISYSAQDTTLSASVANLGGVRSGAFEVLFYAGNPQVGGAPIDSAHIDSLTAFASRRVSVPWRASLGTTTVYVAVDPRGALADRERGNNETYADVVQSTLPDLVVVSGSIDVLIGSGANFTLSARVANTGAANTLAVGVEFFRGDPDEGGVLIGDQLLPTVAVQETLTVSVQWASPDSVTNPIFVVVDRATGIAELREDNNRASRSLGPVVDVPHAPVVPLQLALHPARPNPFTAQTAMQFDLPVIGQVSLDVFDVAGRHVKTLASGIWLPGLHVVQWNGRASDGHVMAAGVYFTRLVAPGGTLVRRVVLIK